MRDHISFFKLDNEGFIHHIHSDSFNIYVHYEDAEDNILYRLTLDKDYIIKDTEVIDTPFPIDEIDFIKWHRPDQSRQGDLIFAGCLNYDGADYRFSINRTQLKILSPIKLNDSFSFSDIPVLADKEVILHVQKGNLLYAVVWDVELSNYGAYEFYEISLANNNVLRRYVIDCCDGDIIIKSLNIDYWCNRIYIAGVKEVNTSPHGEVKFKPFIETLLYIQT